MSKSDDDLRCPICGGEEYCDFSDNVLGKEINLSPDDWKEIWDFIRGVELPFFHGIIARARKRNQRPGQPEEIG